MFAIHQYDRAFFIAENGAMTYVIKTGQIISHDQYLSLLFANTLVDYIEEIDYLKLHEVIADFVKFFPNEQVTVNFQTW